MPVTYRYLSLLCGCLAGEAQVGFSQISKVLSQGMRSRKPISCTVLLIPRISLLTRGSTGYDGYKKVNGNQLSALVEWNGLSLACTVAPANIHDSQLYEPMLGAFEIPSVREHPLITSVDPAYDAREIRQYNQKRGIKSNIPINKRSRKHPKRGKSVWFDPELYKERNAVERFFSWTEAFKTIVSRYERYEHSFFDLIHLAYAIMIRRFME